MFPEGGRGGNLSTRCRGRKCRERLRGVCAEGPRPRSGPQASATAFTARTGHATFLCRRLWNAAAHRSPCTTPIPRQDDSVTRHVLSSRSQSSTESQVALGVPSRCLVPPPQSCQSPASPGPALAEGLEVRGYRHPRGSTAVEQSPGTGPGARGLGGPALGVPRSTTPARWPRHPPMRRLRERDGHPQPQLGGVGPTSFLHWDPRPFLSGCRCHSALCPCISLEPTPRDHTRRHP